MKKKQKMEDNFTEKAKGSDYKSGSSLEQGMDSEFHPSDLPTSEIPVDHISGFHTENGSDSQKLENESSEHQEVDKLEKEVAELKDKYVRLYAEFDNFKRRTSKERSDLYKTANKEVLVSIIPVLDDLERAQKSFVDVKEIGPIKEGISLIISKFKNLMTQQGITEIQSIGENFDTDLHEAITNVPAPSENMKGKVMDEMEKGYKLHDKVIRFAKVIVGV